MEIDERRLVEFLRRPSVSNRTLVIYLNIILHLILSSTVYNTITYVLYHNFTFVCLPKSNLLICTMLAPHRHCFSGEPLARPDVTAASEPSSPPSECPCERPSAPGDGRSRPLTAAPQQGALTWRHDNFQDAPISNSLYVFLHRRMKDPQLTVPAVQAEVPHRAPRPVRRRSSEPHAPVVPPRARGGSPTGVQSRPQRSERLHRKLAYPSEPETGGGTAIFVCLNTSALVW